MFRIALAQLPGEAEQVTIDEQAWADYERCALDAEDMRQQRKDQGRLTALRLEEAGYSTGQALTALTKDVTWNGHDIGRRQLVRPWTRPGTVLWVLRVGSGRCGDLRGPDFAANIAQQIWARSSRGQVLRLLRR